MKSVLLVMLLCVSAFGVGHPDPEVNACIQSFVTFHKYKVPEESVEELAKLKAITIEGAKDLNPFEIRNTIYGLGSYGFFSDVVRSPTYLSTIKELLMYADSDSFSLMPFNIDIKKSFERFIAHQNTLRHEDPYFDNRLACEAIDFASEWFLDHGAPSLFELFSRYDEMFQCGMRGPLLNGKFIRRPGNFRKDK